MLTCMIGWRTACNNIGHALPLATEVCRHSVSRRIVCCRHPVASAPRTPACAGIASGKPSPPSSRPPTQVCLPALQRVCGYRPSSSCADAGATARVGRLNHVAIAVPDLAVAARRYRDVLGAQARTRTLLAPPTAAPRLPPCTQRMP